MSLLNRLAGDLSVGAKLLLGFGLVLLLTIGVALAAFRSLDMLQRQTEQMVAATRIQASILATRIAEKEFAINAASSASSASADVEGKVQGLMREITDDTVSTDPAGMRDAVQRYLNQFLGFADSLKVAREARATMQELAQVAGDSFTVLLLDQLEALNSQAEQNISPSSEQLILLEQIADLRDKLAKLRDYEAYYSQDGEERYRNDWEVIMSDLGSAIQSLNVGSQDQESLQAARNALRDYRKAFETFVESRKQSARSNAAMTSETHEVSELLALADQHQALAMQAEKVKAYRQLGFITALALVLGMGAAWMIRQLIVQPLRDTVKLARHVAAGDLVHRLEYRKRGDELGQLLDTVHGMLDGLRGLVGRIGSGVNQLNDASHCLDEVIQRSSIGVAKQQQETEMAATAMRQMSTSAQEVARNAAEASIAVTQADHLASEGNDLMRQAGSKIDLLASEMTGCADAMHSLLEESASIGGVLDVIKSFADQTNLLALNAAIEAARAGDHGRGFAVVADEVRGLARRTQLSTAEIEGMIDRLREVVQHAAERLHGSRSLTDETVVLAGQVSRALERITFAVSKIEQMNQQIALASEQQNVVADDVSQNMERVREVAEKRKEESMQLLTSTAELQNVGMELNAAVGHFRT